jgi:hypothetical protein
VSEKEPCGARATQLGSQQGGRSPRPRGSSNFCSPFFSRLRAENDYRSGVNPNLALHVTFQALRFRRIESWMSGVSKPCCERSCAGVQRDTTDLIAPPQSGWGVPSWTRGEQGEGRWEEGTDQIVQTAQEFRAQNFFDATGPAPPSWWCQPEACCEVLARGSAVRSMVGGIAAASSGFGSLLTRSPRSLLVSSLGFAAAAP